MRPPILPTTWMYGRRRLSRLELSLYAAAASVAAAIFLDTALAYMELAEKAAVEITVSATLSAINNEVAIRMLRGSAPRVGEWAGLNPFAITGYSPATFRAQEDRQVGFLERPCWFFDSARGELVYVPRLRRGLNTSGGVGELHFRLEPQANGLGYRLVSTSSYEWAPL